MKCYLIDLALRNAILKLNESVLADSVMMGFYAENLVFNALRQFAGMIELAYYKDAKRELDFVVHVGGKRYVPIEVKYRETVDDLAAIHHFLKEYGQTFGVVVTKDLVKTPPEEQRLLFVPLAIFLLFF